MRGRIGLSVMPLETRHEALIELATEGDRLGYTGFFMPETCPNLTGEQRTLALATFRPMLES